MAVIVAGCGSSLTPNGVDAGGGAGGVTGSAGTTGGGGTSSGGTMGPGGSAGSTPTGPCASLSGCDCLAASDRCTVRSEACWCPTECYPGAPIDCVCGGGHFLACEDNPASSCATALSTVQTKCAGQPFVQYIANLCTGNGLLATCTAGCLANLANTGSCSEIDCGFCTVCDCAGPVTPSPFAACLANCRTQGLD